MMRQKYMIRQLILIASQLGVIIYLGVMGILGEQVTVNHVLHMLLVAALLWDSAFISYRNIQNNRTLNQFTFLLQLASWQFLLVFFAGDRQETVFLFLMAATLYLTASFLLVFLFQDSAYAYRRGVFILMGLSCGGSMAGAFLSGRFFAMAYLIQHLITLMAVLFLITVHWRRIFFVIRTQKKELLWSFGVVVLPFLCYMAVFHNQSAYLENLAGYLVMMLSCVSVHSIVFKSHSRQEELKNLRGRTYGFLCLLVVLCFAGFEALFRMPLITAFAMAHTIALLVQIYHLLLYQEMHNRTKEGMIPFDRQHFYAYSLSQMKREESLRKEVESYLHDEILQDLLSIRNLISKADKPEVRKLIMDTLEGLNTSIRTQMQAYRPAMIKSLTLKENIQGLLDAAEEKPVFSGRMTLNCDDDIFLVEPYNVIIYRTVKELITNVVKHAEAGCVNVSLTQEKGMIYLSVSDNGKGFNLLEEREETHRGLNSIREQISLLDGKMSVDTSPGQGTRVTITMPMKGEDSYESFISG